MSVPLILAFLWLILANLIGMLPSRDHHWRIAYVMIALGLPLLVWVSWTSGLLVGVFFLLAASSILRWPVYFLWRWVRQAFGG